MAKYKKKEDKRRKIIEAYASLLRLHPFEDISLRDIEETCGISHRMFYYYFKNKEEILSELMKYTWIPYLEEQDAALAALTPQQIEDMTFSDKIRFILRTTLGDYSENAAFLMAVFSIINSPKLKIQYQELCENYYTEFARRIASLNIEKSLAAELSYQLTAVIDGITMDSRFLPPAQVEKMIERFADVFIQC